MKKKFLILGANSFSGSTFVNYLLNENQIVYGTFHSSKKKINLTYLFNKNYKNFTNIKIDSSRKRYK